MSKRGIILSIYMFLHIAHTAYRGMVASALSEKLASVAFVIWFIVVYAWAIRMTEGNGDGTDV